MSLPKHAIDNGQQPLPGELSVEINHTFDRDMLDYIRLAARRGVYDIRGMGAKRRVPSFDDLSFLTASASRYPLEGL